MIDSIKLVATPGDKTAIEITTLNAAGQDVGYRGVLSAGKQYQARFVCIFKSNSPDLPGPDLTDEVYGTGGIEPLYGGKTREEVEGDGKVHYPDSGTGPNPGYKLSNIFDLGGQSWIWDLGCRFMANFHHVKNGLLTIQGHLGDLTTQSLVLRIEKGRCVEVVKD